MYIFRVDNPKLQSISLGKYSLRGSESESCSISMISGNISYWFIVDLYGLIYLGSKGYSFDYPRMAVIHSTLLALHRNIDVPNLNTVELKCGWSDPFTHVTTKSIVSTPSFLVV